MPVAKLNPTSARKHLQAFRFGDLFVEDLGWNHPDSTKPLSVELDEVTWQAREISQLSGYRVIEVTPTTKEAPFPDAKAQNALWKRVSPHAVENILIFVDPQRTRSEWLWMKRDGGKTHPRRHHYLKGQPGDLFLSKLSSLVVDLSELDEDGNIPITETAKRVRAGLDIETVTKRFFSEFAEEHVRFLETISGIPDDHDRRWYASVILNRLMFIWFLQKKRFLDTGNEGYLSAKLADSMAGRKNTFFSHFLRDLFFEGFARPASKRKPVGKLPLGDIPYLNGGLFLPHGIEARIEGESLFTKAYGEIAIPDESFVRLLGTEELNGHKGLFASYSWSLNDTPGGDDREINPDVLGYIFEKYINQKEFGAYYTRPEITEYLCEQTIHQLVLDGANKHADAAALLYKQGLKKGTPTRRFDTMSDLLLQADGTICRLLLQDDLPRLSLLDPACGSGAFLVAAMKTLLGITTGLIGRCEAIGERSILGWIEAEKKKHKAPVAYWVKKKIITENLYGVDIMEEAVEIAKLRLFLTLVASAETRDQLEPLPNIEFNLLPGNSLIGLLHVDPAKYDQRTGAGRGNGDQGRMSMLHEPGAGDLAMVIETKVAPTRKEVTGAYLAKRRAARYEDLLREKNRLVHLYKQTGGGASSNQAGGELKELTGLRDQIEAANKAAREILNKLLLEEFQGLGIQFEQATWDEKKKKEGKPEKRPLEISDIEALHPFHWAYEFDEIIVHRGGFDAIITNPPWEAVEPKAKEFFSEHSDLVTKNKMTIQDFKKEQARLLKSPGVMDAWLDYHSRFNHLRVFFRTSPQYVNQVPVIDGRRHGKDVNLYKLFLEQCLHIMHSGGRCGIVIPSGIYTDLGAKQLRETLFERTRVTGLFGFENRKQIFENVDSRFKFVVLTFENGGATKMFPVAFMRHDVSELSTFPEQAKLQMPVDLIRKTAPESLSICEYHSELDFDIAEKCFRFPPLGQPIKGRWHLELHREFNMTDDAHLFRVEPAKGRLPLYEGKMIHQFDHRFGQARYWLDRGEAHAALIGSRIKVLGRLAEEYGLSGIPKPDEIKLDYTTYRLAFRDVAASTNERTMIATILQAEVFCPHTMTLEVVFHDELRDGQWRINCARLTMEERLYVLSLLNSFVVDFQLRQRITNHLSFFFVYSVPIPRLTAEHPDVRPLVERAARLVGTTVEFDDLMKDVYGSKATHKTHGITDPFQRQTVRAEIDALVARLYDLTDIEFQHILGTFPLVDEAVKSQTLNTYRDLLKLGKLPDTRA